MDHSPLVRYIYRFTGFPGGASDNTRPASTGDIKRRGLDPWVGKIHSQEPGLYYSLLKHINIIYILYMYFIELYNSYYNCDKIVDQALFSTCNVLLAEFQRDLFYFEV